MPRISIREPPLRGRRMFEIFAFEICPDSVDFKRKRSEINMRVKTKYNNLSNLKNEGPRV